MPDDAAQPEPADGVIPAAILFADLVNSSDFAGILGLRDYAAFVDEFHAVCATQCQHFFGRLHAQRMRPDLDYDVQQSGDELLVYVHTDRPANDVYQLVCFAVALKCAWLGSDANRRRLGERLPAAELAVGIHSGPVWGVRRAGSRRRGYAVNLAKRVESASRGCERSRVLLSDAAFKAMATKTRHVLFGPRRLLDLKGVAGPVGTVEVADSFIDPTGRLAPEFRDRFLELAPAAVRLTSHDTWVHDCYQVAMGARHRCVTDECLQACRHMLHVQPDDAVALYYAAQGLIERGRRDEAELHLRSLARAHPRFGDGWLELGRLLKSSGDTAQARDALLNARRYGVGEEEEALP